MTVKGLKWAMMVLQIIATSLLTFVMELRKHLCVNKQGIHWGHIMLTDSLWCTMSDSVWCLRCVGYVSYFENWFSQSGWLKSYFSEMYFGGVQFESWLGHYSCDWVSLWYFSATADKWLDSGSVFAMTISLHILSNSFFTITLSLDAVLWELLTP
jgi:hypothetical protein